MASRHYGQFLEAADVGQSADDVFTLGTAPPEIARGSFKIYYRPRDDSSYATPRSIVSIQWLDDQLVFALEPSEGGDTLVTVRLGGEVQAVLGPITFAADAELAITFSGSAGTITLEGAATGDGTSDPGAQWNVPQALLRLGGSVLGGDVARGLVSLPYAVPGALLPDPIPLQPSSFDFSDEDNSALIALI